MTIKPRLSQPNPAAVWTALPAGEAVGESADLPGLDVTVSACWLLQSSLDVTVRHSFSPRLRDRCSSLVACPCQESLSVFVQNFHPIATENGFQLIDTRIQDRAGGKQMTH